MTRRRGGKQGRIRGRLSCHPHGYGFVTPEEEDAGPREDIFIPPHCLGNANHGDLVEVRLRPSRARRGQEKGPEGEILRVLTPARPLVLGRLFRFQKESLVAPLDERYRFTVRLLDEAGRRVAPGQIVAVEIVAHATRKDLPVGRLVEVLGDPADPEIQYKIVCYAHDIPLEFPAPVRAQAERVSFPGPRPSGLKRQDLQDLPAVTIDGATARDFDDAVCVERGERGGFRLFVHIADVSHYVQEGSLLDGEAYRRGTSVYFPDRAIPMLPPRLSTDLCSLNPGVERLTLSVVLEITAGGEVQSARFFPSRIRSRYRMTYDQVFEILSRPESPLREKYRDFVEQFLLMRELCRLLQGRRLERGALDFDLPEAELEYDLSGGVHDIVRAERNEAHRLIEEFMLAANEAVARFLSEQEVPALYRVHEPPDPRKVESFLEIAARWGYRLRPSGRHYRTADFQVLIRQWEGRPEERSLSYLLLRSFQQARYSAFNTGHFGLASDCYTHFTSPIRRYPDLVVHRILKGVLAGGTRELAAGGREERLEEIALHSSRREREAMEAEREILKWLMARFMADKVGEEYEGFITGVKANGFFVELLEPFVEGFVPVQTLWDDFYVFHPKGQCLIGEETGKVYRLGDRVRVRVDKVNTQRHLIDFSPVLPP